MGGYFKSLVKQSGVAIGASNTSAVARGSTSRSVAAEPVTPLHVEMVAMVGPTTGDVEHVEGKTTITKPAYEAGEHFRSRDPIAVDNDATTNTPTVISNNLTDTDSDQTGQAVLDQSEPEPDVVQQSTVVTATTPKTTPEVNVSTNEVVEHRTETTPGVIRVGEIRNVTDQEQVVESDARTPARPEFSIPPNYLEGIREWLTSTPVKSDENRVIDQHDDDDPGTLRQTEQSLHSTIELDRSSQEELQEFSLSIGSISIVVEEPARQPPPPSTALQPVEHAPANAQPRANDAFALSRSYFRGF